MLCFWNLTKGHSCQGHINITKQQLFTVIRNWMAEWKDMMPETVIRWSLQRERMSSTVLRYSCQSLSLKITKNCFEYGWAVFARGVCYLFIYLGEMLQIVAFVLFLAPKQQNMSDDCVIPVSIAHSHKTQGVSVWFTDRLPQLE